jgi:hypothetical protein
MLSYLHRKGKINEDTMNETVEFLRKHSYEASLQTEATNGNGVH